MKLSSVFDFYYLSALSNKHNQAVDHSDSENMDIRHAIKEDTLRSLSELATNCIADSFYAYAFVSAFGEARHVRNRANGGRIPRDLKCSISRNQAYDFALEYNPAESREVLASVFGDCSWHSAYGGDAWHKIARSMDLYHEVKIITDYYTGDTRVVNGKAIFIDHLIDLKHNGGSLFDKSGALDIAEIERDIAEGELMAFLDFKRDNDILSDLQVSTQYTQYLSREVADLLGLVDATDYRWSLRLKVDNEDVLSKFGDCVLGEYGYINHEPSVRCEGCCDQILESESYSHDGYYYCASCMRDLQNRREARAARRERKAWARASQNMRDTLNHFSNVAEGGLS
jgi:hypothetical protein